MLFLEDYVEMIENQPVEMRDKLTEMRELDLQVQNTLDSCDEKVRVFFKKCQSVPPPKNEWKEEQLSTIKQEYHKALEDADEKVHMANQLYDMIERDLRKLDQEISKFKMELEADNAGITEVLEKRSLELDKQPQPSTSGSGYNNNTNGRSERRKNLGFGSEKRNFSEPNLASTVQDNRLTVGRHSHATPSPSAFMFASTPATSINYSLGHVTTGTSNAAIAAAASRAIGATLQMPQGRRTASLKASYEAVARNADLSLASGASAPSTPLPDQGKPPKSKKARLAAQQQPIVQPTVLPPVETLVSEEPHTSDTAGTSTWTADPNEPRYCVCNEVSYGDMVGCDNEDCPIEWFHYACVGLLQAPKGKWYCHDCTVAMKRRGRK